MGHTVWKRPKNQIREGILSPVGKILFQVHFDRAKPVKVGCCWKGTQGYTKWCCRWTKSDWLLNFWRLQWTQEGFLENLMVNFCQNHFQPKLRSYLENKNIGVFINSVGVSFPVPQMLHDVKSEYPKLHSNLINVNLRMGYQFGTV